MEIIIHLGIKFQKYSEISKTMPFMIDSGVCWLAAPSREPNHTDAGEHQGVGLRLGDCCDREEEALLIICR